MPIKHCMRNNTCPAFFSPCLSRIQAILLACGGTENYSMPLNEQFLHFLRFNLAFPGRLSHLTYLLLFSFQVLEPQVSRNVANYILAFREFQPGPLAIYRPTIQQISYGKAFEDLYFSNIFITLPQEL